MKTLQPFPPKVIDSRYSSSVTEVSHQALKSLLLTALAAYP